VVHAPFAVQQRFVLDKNNKPLCHAAMDLKSYLNQSELDAATFAGRIGVTKEAVRLWLAGDRTPRRLLMRRIAEETKGAVTANDFMTGSVTALDAPDAAA
jgi:DNA-binding transcriptional regulator YiaG